MFNVCYNCGQYRADKAIDPAGPAAICPECGWRHPFKQQPLLLLCGASGTGKSTLAAALTGRLPEVVVLDADILWRPEFNTPEDGYRDFFATWLRLAKNIGQSGRPVLLCGAGFIPGNVEPCVERRYFSAVHCLALVADDDALRGRLRDRSAWRESSSGPFQAGQLQFNDWLQQQAAAESGIIAALDTTAATKDEAAQAVMAWARRRLAE